MFWKVSPLPGTTSPTGRQRLEPRAPSAAQCVAQPVNSWEAACFSSEKKPRAGRGKPGGNVLTCSLFTKFWDWENLSKQLLPKFPISQSKADLLQQEIPTNQSLLSCHIAASISLPASQPRGQQYQISYMRNASKPQSTVNCLPQGCSVTCAILAHPLHSGDFRQPGAHMDFTPMSCFSATTQEAAQSFGEGRGDQSV